MIKKTVVLLLLYLVSALPVAAAGHTAEVRIPVSCTGMDTPETFHYSLHAEKTEGQSFQTDRLSLKDGQEGYFSVIYDRPGTYHYTARQSKGSDEQTDYDDTVYSVDVYVTEAEDGELSAEPVAYIQDHDDKKESLDFVNKRTVPVVDAGSGNNGSGDDGRKNNGSNEDGGENKGSGDNNKQDVIRSSAKTGDDTRPDGFFILFCIASAAVLFLALGRKTRSGSGENSGRESDIRTSAVVLFR